jgi:acyl carrier protein
MDRLTAVFRRVFDDPSIVITPATVSTDIDGWDSLSHVNLIAAIEVEFNIEFKQREIISFKNVGELLQSIENKLRG